GKGKKVWSWKHDPFGSNDPIGQRNFTFDLRFPGQIHDNETGLSYNMMRDYRQDAGRYVQSDPVGLFAGVNTYGYVRQNPLSSVDPLGDISRNDFYNFSRVLCLFMNLCAVDTSQRDFFEPEAPPQQTQVQQCPAPK